MEDIVISVSKYRVAVMAPIQYLKITGKETLVERTPLAHAYI